MRRPGRIAALVLRACLRHACGRSHALPAPRPSVRLAGAALAAVLVLVDPGSGTAAAREGELCERAIRRAERSYDIPRGLLLAVALTETGRWIESALQPWPWSVNGDGSGVWFDDRGAALQHVAALQARGIESIDVGCMQVNLKWHGDRFASLDEAFDPQANVDYAARFLRDLRATSRTWLEAAKRYHSSDPVRGAGYADRVTAHWRPDDGRSRAALPDAPGGVRVLPEVVPGPVDAILAGLPAGGPAGPSERRGALIALPRAPGAPGARP